MGAAEAKRRTKRGVGKTDEGGVIRRADSVLKAVTEGGKGGRSM